MHFSVFFLRSAREKESRGLAISIAVLGFNLFGDTLRDAWDPKLRNG